MKNFRKRIFTCALAFILIAQSFADIAFAADDDYKSIISDPSFYYISDYKSSDCVLSANMYMLRRAAVKRGSLVWDEITNTSLRSYACTSKYNSSLKYEYEFELDGISYTVTHGYLNGSATNKKNTLKSLLDDHPEGVVVRGPSTSGGHGVLITGYKEDTLYTVDSAQNIKNSNVGITTFGKTTMTNFGGCTHYWYLSKCTGKSESKYKQTGLLMLQAAQYSDLVILSWEQEDPDIELDGYIIYQKGPEDDTYVKIGTTDNLYFSKEGYSLPGDYRFYVKGYKKINGHTVYTDKEYVQIDLSFGLRVV